ncbi:MAG: polyprenol monophosphomannose synthase [bacterium]
MKPIKNLLAIIPTYNEKENIVTVIERVLANDPRIAVLVVDDASPDGTGDIVEKMLKKEPRIYLLRRTGKMGLGTAYVAGFTWALEKGYDAVVEIDADLSHNPEDIIQMMQIAEEEEADFVIGSRYVDGVNVVNWPLKRLLLSYFASVYSRFATGMPFCDLTAGFAVIRADALRAIDLNRIHSNGYSFQIEVKFKIWKKGFKLIECPIVFTERRLGQSKMSKKIVYEAIWMVWKLRFRAMFGLLK